MLPEWKLAGYQYALVANLENDQELGTALPPEAAAEFLLGDPEDTAEGFKSGRFRRIVDEDDLVVIHDLLTPLVVKSECGW